MLVRNNETGKLVVVSRTPRVNEVRGDRNRKFRRGLIYTHAVARIIHNINELRKEMKEAMPKGIRLPPMPRSTRMKYLSGYYSGLIREAEQLSQRK